MGRFFDGLRGLALIAATCASCSALAQEAGDEIFVPIELAGLSGDLAVEIDGIDMTEFVSVADGGLVVGPAVPFPPGTYEIVIYLWRGDDYEIVGRVTHKVEGPGGASGRQVTVNANNEAGVRSFNGDDQETFARSGGEVEVTTVDTRLSAGASWLATTEEDDQLDGRPVDLGEYYIEWRLPGDRVDTTLRFGNQALDFDRLMVADVTRRGLSAKLDTTDGRLSFGLFTVQSSEDLGGDNLLGVNNADDRTAGAVIAFTPSESVDLTLGVAAAKGRGDPRDLMQTGQGQGLSFFARGSFGDGRTRYRLDFGETRWDEDAELAVADPVTARAALLGLERDVLTGEDGRTLTLGFAIEQVDTGFLSLANPLLTDARRDLRVTADYGTEALTLTALLEHQTTNVNGPPDYETDHIVTLQIDGGYIPYLDGTPPGWMGSPELLFGAAIITQNRIETPPMAPDPQDFLSLEFYGGLNVQHDLWGWGATYTYSDFDEQSAANADLRSHRVDGTLDWSDGGRLNLAANAAFTWADDPLGSWVDTEMGLTASYEIEPGVWAASIEAVWYDYGAPGAIDGASIGADLTWSFAPTADLVFSGGWARGASASATPKDPEWFVGLMLRQTTSFARGGF